MSINRDVVMIALTFYTDIIFFDNVKHLYSYPKDILLLICYYVLNHCHA